MRGGGGQTEDPKAYRQNGVVGLDISLDDCPPPNTWQRSVNASTWSLLIQILRCVLGLFYLKSELDNLNDHQQMKQIKKCGIFIIQCNITLL